MPPLHLRLFQYIRTGSICHAFPKKGFPPSYLFVAYVLRRPLKVLNNSIIDFKSSQDQFKIILNFQRSPIPQSWERLLEAQYILLALLLS